MRRISKDITKHCQMACSSGELHAICFLWAHVFYVLFLPFITFFCYMCVAPLNVGFVVTSETLVTRYHHISFSA